jgi:hypothetical protein
LKEFTIQFWGYYDSITSNSCFVGFNEQTNWSNGFGHYQASGKFKFIVGPWSGKSDSVEAKEVSKEKVWVHYAITYSKSKELTLYINGKLIEKKTVSKGFEYDKSVKLTFGNNYYSSNVYRKYLSIK